MAINSFINSLFNSTSYLMDGEILIDCGDWHDEYATVKTVLLTHAHFDHIYGLNELMIHSPNVRIYTNEAGRKMLFDSKKNMSHYNDSPFELANSEVIRVIEDGEEIFISNGVSAKAIFTPGHNPSCITWLIGDALFSGDAYIPGLKTVTNLPGGNKLQAVESIAIIKQLAANHIIFPGHKI